MLFELAGLEVDLDVGPTVVVEHPATFVIPPPVDRGVAAPQQASDVVVPPDIKDHVLGAVLGPLLAQHTPIGLIHTITAHSEIADGLPEMSSQVFLPRLAIADLVTEGETVSIGVDA